MEMIWICIAVLVIWVIYKIVTGTRSREDFEKTYSTLINGIAPPDVFNTRTRSMGILSLSYNDGFKSQAYHIMENNIQLCIDCQINVLNENYKFSWKFDKKMNQRDMADKVNNDVEAHFNNLIIGMQGNG